MASKKAKKKRARRESTGASKSDFIRQHPDLSPAELLEKAEQAGLSMSKNLIYAVRTRAADAKGDARASSGRSGKASDFIREQLSKGLRPTEIIEAGKQAGIQFSPNLVYAVKGKMGVGPTGRRGRGVTGSSSENELAFKRMAFDIGLRRARELLDDLEQGLQQLFR